MATQNYLELNPVQYWPFNMYCEVEGLHDTFRALKPKRVVNTAHKLEPYPLPYP